MADRTITTDLVGRDRSLGSSLDGAGKKAGKLHGVMGKLGGVMKGGLAAGAVGAGVAIAGVGKFLLDGVKAAASYNKRLAMTAQVIKTTGGAAKVSVSGVKNLAAELETMSGVDEELIINSQNVLLTFTNIRNVGKEKIFDQATKSALDMSQALGTSLQGASIQVGKALNDPIKGVTALSKVGVSFSQSQKDVIKQMVATGDTMGAQKLILAELNKEFGGQAAAAGKGFEGTMARLQDVVSDTGRDIGQMLLPKLTDAAEWLGKKIPVAVQQFKDGWKGIGDDTEIGALATSLHNLSDELGGLTQKAGDTKSNGFIKFAHSTISSLTTVSEGFELLGANWRTITATISKWNDTVAINFQKMVVNIARAGAKLPGPMGRHFKKIADDGQREINRLQGKLDQTNTRLARSRLDALEIRLRHLGRQRPTPKVLADISQARAQADRITAKLRGIPDQYVNVFVSEINRDRATAGRSGGVAGRASGGPVTAGTPYIVGEHRPELFVPERSGRIVPQVPTQRGGGGDTYYVSVAGVIAGSHNELVDTILKALEARPAGARKIPARVIGHR